MRPELRRRVYLSGMLLGVPMIMLGWVLRQDDAVLRFGYPVLALYLAVAALALLRRPGSLVAVERTTYWFITGTWMAMMAYRLARAPDVESAWWSLSPQVFMGLALQVVFAYVVYDTERAWWRALVQLVGSCAIGFAHFVPRALSSQDSTYVVELVRYEVFLAVILVFVHVLSRGKDESAVALLEAQRMRSMAYHDALTGLVNRRRLQEELEVQHALAGRYGRPFSVIFFDLDHFKQLNDNLGHSFGDRVLRDVSEVIAPLLRVSDLLGRWGGEEFLVIAPETEATEASELAERIRAAVDSYEGPQQHPVTASFGVASYRSGDSVDELLNEVDLLLYRAKAEGRNRVAVTQESIRHPLGG